MQKSYDAIVIGAGHNGLVTASLLARRGLRVLVLERREIVGGACVTEEVFPGFKFSTAAYLVSLLQQRVVRELDLPRFGFHVDPKDPAFFSVFPDGRSLTTWQDGHKTATEISRFSQRDGEAYPRYSQFVDRMARLVEPLLFTIPPQLPPSSLSDWVDFLRTATAYRKLDETELRGLFKISSQSAFEFLAEWFESDQIQATLATDAVIGANGGPMSPGTAYVLLHHYMGGVGGVRGLWGFARGGMGSVTRAMADSSRHAGADIRCDAPVAQVVVKDGAATGVLLENGEEIPARAVISNADPKRTFLQLVASTDLKKDFLESIRNYRCEGTSLKINLALDGLPEFRGAPKSGPHYGATIHICPGIEYMERAWDDCKYGYPSKQPIVEMTFPTVYDPSLAPPGKHIMGIFVQYAPYTLRDGTWDQIRESFADQVIDCIAEYAPGIRSLILHRQVLTPLDLERVYGLTGGNIFHGAMSLDQMFACRPVLGWARYTTPVRNLYLCGSGAHPGGGVIGAAGYNAAQRILKDLGR